jgi:lipid II isoglutaminyl synthase (glutamine-hydrolysing)
MMFLPYATLLGKAVRKIALLRGGGSALPGLFIEKIDPQFIKRTLSQLPQGVVVISGTNGKTTTTKMTVELLEGQGLKVFTNRTGSNFTRGVAAALLAEVDTKGNLDADIAVLELDEAHAIHFIKSVPPRYSLLLNVMRDQLDRFGEIDSTAKLLAKIALSTTDTVVLNREDPRVAKIASILKDQKSVYFGLSADLMPLFPNDDDIHGEPATLRASTLPADVILSGLNDDTAQFTINNRGITTKLELKGVYNVYNAAAALALTRTILEQKLNEAQLIDTLSHVTPAFGRGETLTIDGQPLELVLVKNPSGFRLSLASFKPAGYQTMIAINDNYADGRDMSWLWDVDFETLRKGGVSTISGLRANDMALRLQYDEVEAAHVDTDLAPALQHFITSSAGSPKRIFCTYTAMLALRRELARITDVEIIT